MGDHRCISRRIVESFSFLQMPLTAQYLYIHLILNTDDRGVVEAGNILRLTNTNIEDLQILVDTRYVVPLNSDLVAYIPHMNEHNQLRSDRMKESRYRDLLVKVVPDVYLKEITQRADKSKKDGDVPGTSYGRPNISKEKVSQDKNKPGFSQMICQNYDFNAIENKILGH